MVDWKKLPQFELPSLPNIAMAVVILKILSSEVSYPLATLVAAVAALFIAKVIFEIPRLDLQRQVLELVKRNEEQKLDLQRLKEVQVEVFKQAEETKAILSKLNLSSAFSPRVRG